MNYNYLINNNLILNKYKIENINYNINIYYVHDYLCKIILIGNNNINVDNNHNNNIDIKIRLYDVSGIEEEIISIGSLNKDYKIIEIYTKTKLIKSEISYITDKKILLNGNINNNYINLIFNNTNIEFIYYDDIYKREFIKNNYNTILDLYDLYKDVNFKYIIFVCIYIYINGGIYINENIELLKLINDIGFKNNIITNKNILLLLISDKNNEYILNYIDSLIYSKFIKDNYFNKNKINLSINKPINDYNKEQYNFLNKINDYIFLIEYNQDKYLIEYLNLDYYIITCFDNNFDNNFYIICLNNKNNIIKKIELNKDKLYYPNKYFFRVLF
jgi:hypothetical protein